MADQYRHYPVSPYDQPQNSYAPQSQQPPFPAQTAASRSRTKSLQSGKSGKSGKSNKSSDHHTHPKTNTHETSAEKQANRLHSKADPTMAISEAEPAAVQAMTKSSLAPLRAIQHKDAFGNPIAEPDQSNPTRSRWERPLDTIRSFEAAIDGGYSRRASYIRPDTDSAANWNRRSSYYAGGHGSRSALDSPYNGRPGSMRPESTYLDYQYSSRPGHLEQSSNQNGGGGYGPGPSRQRASRMLSEPANNGYGNGSHHHQNVYPLPHKDRSYETVTTATGSGGSEQAGYQTDLTSSENSSIDRPSPTKRQERRNDYGTGFNQPSTHHNPAFSIGGGQRAPGPGGAVPQQAPPGHNAGAMGPPPVPRKNVGSSRGGSILRRKSSGIQQPDTAEKRKSWFSRRFNKQS